MRKLYTIFLFSFTIFQSQAQYCSSAATSTADEDILNVTFQTINNSSACVSAGVGRLYTDFTGSVAPAIVWPGGTFNISTTVGVCGNFGFSTSVAAFIDYNKNFSLTDPGEKAYASATFQNSLPNAVFSGNITIPLTASQGLTRLRVVAVETTSSAGIVPCGTYSWGETEDYNIMILPQPIANDMGMSVFNNPLPTECLTKNTSITVTVFNYGTNNQTNVPIHLSVSGANTANVSAIIPGTFNSFTEQQFTFTGIDLSNFGSNTIKVFTGLLTDGRTTNDTITVIRTFAAPTPMPYSENFEAGVTPTGYTGNMLFNTTFGVMHGKSGTKGMYFNLWNGATSFSETLPKVGTLRNDAVFSFDYRIVNRTGYLNPGGVATNTLSDDSLTLWMSSDCGTTFQHVQTITGLTYTPTNLFKNVKIFIKGKAGIDPIFRITGKYSVGSGGDYFVDIDNINIYNDSNDFSISSLESPAGLKCFKNKTNVIVKVTNNGTARQTNIPVYGEFGGIISPSIFLSSLITDTLAPGSSILVNLGELNTPNFGIINAKISVNYKDENNLSNDTLTTDIFATEPVLIIPTDTIICKFKCTDLFALGSGSPIWSDGQATILISACPTVNTNYWVAATDANNCPDTAYQKIKVNILPELTTMDDSVCKGEFGTISASGALTYDWGSLGMSKKVSDNPITNTVYTVIGTNAS
ncbi:MAG: hypothetical protein KA797_09010, partial [Chitinophagales bacterium]|nr:hypothetical protein [Chitinophagales bacterium]